jgi:NAD(P)-dependent dehydrogenase (short-subunit alcohol dehydrogenase family)
MKVAIVTGCSSGIGIETVRGLGEDDTFGPIICAVRNPKKMMSVMETAGYSGKVKRKCRIVSLELASLDSVDAFVESLAQLKISRMDRLVLNAGINDYSDSNKRTTCDGFDEIWQVNYLSNFYLVLALSPILKATRASRVVCLSSVMHWVGTPDGIKGAIAPTTNWWSTYADTKFAIAVFANELNRRGIVDAVAVNPGSVASDIFREWYSLPFIGYVIRFIFSLVLLTCADGAKTTLYACSDMKERSGNEFVYLSPYGQIKSNWEWLPFVSDIYWFWVTRGPSNYYGQCKRQVLSGMTGKSIWDSSANFIAHASVQRRELLMRI